MESSNTGGVKPMAIAGRMVRERERLHGMTDQERAWRKQWLQDQVLSKNEPREVPEYWKERINPIRRFYMAPLNAVHRALTPVIVSTIDQEWQFENFCNNNNNSDVISWKNQILLFAISSTIHF
jgi:hypothetical protein